MGGVCSHHVTPVTSMTFVGTKVVPVPSNPKPEPGVGYAVIDSGPSKLAVFRLSSGRIVYYEGDAKDAQASLAKKTLYLDHNGNLESISPRDIQRSRSGKYISPGSSCESQRMSQRISSCLLVSTSLVPLLGSLAIGLGFSGPILLMLVIAIMGFNMLCCVFVMYSNFVSDFITDGL